jgi:hypothetical protein
MNNKRDMNPTNLYANEKKTIHNRHVTYQQNTRQPEK